MADDTAGKFEMSSSPGETEAVSLNVGRVPVRFPLGLLTSADIRDLLQIGRSGPISACGCDSSTEGNCGCRGADCTCKKVTNTREAGQIRLADFLREREQTIRQLKQQLEDHRFTSEELARLRDEKP